MKKEKQKSAIAVRKLAISSRRAEVASDQSETQPVSCLRLPQDDLSFITELDLDFIFPPILQVFHKDSQGFRVSGPIID